MSQDNASLEVENRLDDAEESLAVGHSEKISEQQSLDALYSKPNMNSKKELQRQLRREAYREAKKVKKQKKKLEKQLRRELAAESAGQEGGDAKNGSDTNSAEGQDRPTSITQRKRMKKECFASVCANGFHVIIDCSWEDFHTESTLKSLTQQIMFCYGFNRRHEKPVTLHLSSLGPRSIANLQKVAYENWAGLSTSPLDYLQSDQYSVAPSPDKKQLVYLTSDSPNILEKVEDNCAYIIGGIVDRNVYKGATLKKATDAGLRTARLPLREHVTLNASPVLTVNHVFEILLRFAVAGDWKVAIDQTLPQRKGAGAPKSRNQRRKGSRGSENSEQADENGGDGAVEEREQEGGDGEVSEQEN
eukprot:gene42786-52281_t